MSTYNLCERLRSQTELTQTSLCCWELTETCQLPFRFLHSFTAITLRISKQKEHVWSRTCHKQRGRRSAERTIKRQHILRIVRSSVGCLRSLWKNKRSPWETTRELSFVIFHKTHENLKTSFLIHLKARQTIFCHIKSDWLLHEYKMLSFVCLTCEMFWHFSSFSSVFYSFKSLVRKRMMWCVQI